MASTARRRGAARELRRPRVWPASTVGGITLGELVLACSARGAERQMRWEEKECAFVGHSLLESVFSMQIYCDSSFLDWVNLLELV
jgi:hypothetical protein